MPICGSERSHKCHCVYTHIHTYIHTYIHTHSYIHTYIYTHIHTYLSIGDLLQSGSFERCLCAILQQFGVVASVDHQTCDVASVTKLSTSQQDLVRLQGVDLIWGGPTRRGGGGGGGVEKGRMRCEVLLIRVNIYW